MARAPGSTRPEERSDMHSLNGARRVRQFLGVVVGEALPDVVASPEGTSECPGGSPANVAYGLARLGVNAGLLTALGDAERGSAIGRHLRSAGVTLLPGSYSPGRAASATATLATSLLLLPRRPTRRRHSPNSAKTASLRGYWKLRRRGPTDRRCSTGR
jgi:hypothetical protein